MFLGLLVLGFSIPGFLNFEDSVPPASEPRLCQTDRDCILICETPVNVLCSKNLCQQNGCDEFAAVPYADKPVTLFLSIMVEGKEVNLSTRPGDSFVEVGSGEENTIKKIKNIKSASKLQIFSSEMSWPQVLEKFGIEIGECLRLGNSNYCPDQARGLQFKVNGKESGPEYFPQDGDVIEITYS